MSDYFFRSIGDVTIQVEQNKIRIEGECFARDFIYTDLNLYPDTCRGLACLPNQEVHFSIKAEPSGENTNFVNDKISISHVTKSKMVLSQNVLVDKIMLLQNKWYCTTCHQKLLKDRW